MKTFLTYIGTYAGIITIAIISYALSFRTPLYSFMPVYFYRALMLLATMGISLFVVLWFLKDRITYIVFDIKDIGITCISFISIMAVFLSTALVAMDRSISVFILADMSQNPKVIFTEKDVENRFLDIYVEKYGAMNQRFEEQIVSGNIEQIGEGYRITKGGQGLIGFFRFLVNIFPVEGKFLYPPALENKE